MLLFLFFLIIDLYILIPAAIDLLFSPIAELVIHIRIPNKQAKAEIEIHPEIVEAKQESVQYNLDLYKRFCAFYSLIHFALFLLKK